MIILIVEDEPSTSMEIENLIKCQLSDEDIMIKATSRGMSAFELAMELYIDVFVIDIDLPDMDGLSLGLKIRNIKKYRYTPIIIETINIDNNYKAEVHNKLNNIAYITKPFDIKFFVEKIIYAVELAQNNNRYVKIEFPKGFHKYKLNEIVYIEKCSYSNKIQLVWYEDNYGLHSDTFKYHMKNIKDKFLNENSIIQVHQSYMINPEYIYRMDLINNVIILRYINKEIPIGPSVMVKRFCNAIV